MRWLVVGMWRWCFETGSRVNLPGIGLLMAMSTI